MNDLPSEATPAAPAPPTLRELPTRWSLWGALMVVAVASLLYLVVAPTPWAEGLNTTRDVKESIRTNSWVLIGLWYGAAINLGVAVLALLAWNFRPAMIDRPLEEGGKADIEPEAANLRGIERWSGRFLVLVAMAVAAWAMMPRLELSLWGGEEATARRFLIGHVYRQDDGSLLPKHPTWRKAIWNYDNGPNNHMLYNVLARLAHGPADTSGKDPAAFYFSEWKLRLPSFLATLLLIPAAAWLTSLLGFPRGGPLAAFLLALHPWVVRFGSDARGYALLMMLGIVALACLLAALRNRGRARWWIAFGVAQFLLVFSHLSGIYLLLPLNLAGLWLAWSPRSTGQLNPLRVANVWRFSAASLFGAMLTVQMMTPNLLQLPGWLDSGRLTGSVDLELLENWACDWSLGTPWHAWSDSNPNAVTWSELHEKHPLIAFWAAALVGLFFLAGIFVLLWRQPGRWLLLPLLGPAPLMFFDAFRSGNLLYPWYTVGFLPLAFVVVGVGFGALVPAPRKWPGFLAALVPTLAGTLIVGLFAVATKPQRNVYREHAVEPLADSVRLTREVVNPFHPRIDETLTLGFVHATRLYDPAMTLARSDDEFVEAIRRAEQLKRPLWVNAANLGLVHATYPGALALLDDREVFDAPVILYGLQNPCDRYVFRYRPGGLARHEKRDHPP